MQKHLAHTSFSLSSSSSPVLFSFHLFGNSYDTSFLFNLLIMSSEVLWASLCILRLRGLWKVQSFNIL